MFDKRIIYSGSVSYDLCFKIKLGSLGVLRQIKAHIEVIDTYAEH